MMLITVIFYLYLADQTPPFNPGRGGLEDLDGLLQPRRRISGRLLVEKNQTLIASQEDKKVDDRQYLTGVCGESGA